MAISCERVAHLQYEISALVSSPIGEYLFTRRYIGYTKAEATKLFKQAVKLAY